MEPRDDLLLTLESNEQYHADVRCVSSSMLKRLAESPRIYEGTYVTREIKNKDAQHFVTGNGVHCLSLEGLQEYRKRYAESPHDDKRRKPYLDWKKEMLAERPGVECLSASEAYGIRRAVQSLETHPVIQHIARAEGPVEKSHRWRQETHGGVWCKFRPDKVVPSMRLILDLKTISTLSEYQWRKNASDLWYDVQAAHYEAGARAFYGDGDWIVMFAVVESAPPHRRRVYELSSADLEAGREQWDKLLTDWMERNNSGDWSEPDEDDVIATDLSAFTSRRKSNGR